MDKKGDADGAQGKAKPKAKAKSKNGAKPLGKGGQALGRCGNCDAEGAVKKCMQCGTKAYCDRNCQRVSRR